MAPLAARTTVSGAAIRPVFWIMTAVMVCCTGINAAAQPRSVTVTKDYRVRGATERSLVAYMKQRPFPGDRGPAMANIRPRYSLDLETVERSGTCRISRIALSIRFVMTLPRAVDADRFSASTRRNWNRFRAFAKRHEEVHRRIYLGCARRFIATARRQSHDGACFGLRLHVRRLLREQERNCDRLHDAFDRRDLQRLRQLTLFRQARLRPRGTGSETDRAPGFALQSAFKDSDR